MKAASPSPCRGAAAALLLGAAGLLAACGGADDEPLTIEPLQSGASREQPPGETSAQTVVIDMNAVGSLEAAARLAARAHGAPGENEPLLVIVRSRRPADAHALAADLAARGFATAVAASGNGG